MIKNIPIIYGILGNISCCSFDENPTKTRGMINCAIKDAKADRERERKKGTADNACSVFSHSKRSLTTARINYLKNEFLCRNFLGKKPCAENSALMIKKSYSI